MKYIINFWGSLFENRKRIIELAINDCKARFASSGLGMLWSFVQPLLTILVFWFVFQLGFKQAPIDNVVYIVWFAPAYLIWSFFSENLFQTTNALVEYSYLIKKVNFCVDIIPVIKIVSGAIVHCVFILFLLLINLLYGYGIDLYFVQVFYYFFCAFMFLLALGMLLSAVNVFVKDIFNVVSVLIQIGFWATPIFWNPDSMSKGVLNILKINPMYYICMGYRETFVYKIWFWEHPTQTVYFWGITMMILCWGVRTFEKLKPIFDDAL